MEETLGKMSMNMASFFNNLESSSTALKTSLDRRPIPLGSASTTFIQSLNRRVSALSGDLNLLESMTLGTVSFEELLGNCNHLFKQNQSQISELHSQLFSMGYLTSDDGIDETEEDFMAQGNPYPDPKSPLFMKKMEDNSLFDESLNLQSLGLSDICLATLASKGEEKSDVLGSPPKLRGFESQNFPSIPNTRGTGEERNQPESCEASKSIVVLEQDYESLPSYMKNLAPWEDLQSAVEKINSFLSKRANSKEINFHREELESMGLDLLSKTEVSQPFCAAEGFKLKSRQSQFLIYARFIPKGLSLEATCQLWPPTISLSSWLKFSFRSYRINILPTSGFRHTSPEPFIVAFI